MKPKKYDNSGYWSDLQAPRPLIPWRRWIVRVRFGLKAFRRGLAWHNAVNRRHEATVRSLSRSGHLY